MPNISDIIINTPIWVWPLFAFLIFIGFRCGKMRVVKLNFLYIMPSVYLALSLKNIITTEVNIIMIAGWLGGILTATYVSWYFHRNVIVSPDHKNKLIRLPGEWLTLSLIIVYFSIRYYYGYKTSITPEITQDIQFMTIFNIIFGMATGLFFGRAIRFIQKYAATESVDLKSID